MSVSTRTGTSTRVGGGRIEQYLMAVYAMVLAAVSAVARVVVEHHNWVAEQAGAPKLAAPSASMGIMSQVRMIGGAVVGIAVVTLVVNEVLTIESINNSSGPFSGVIDSLESTGVAAMTLLVVGLVVVAASAIMRFMGSGF